MDSFEKWRKTLKSGNYRRKVNNYRKLRTGCEYEYLNNKVCESVPSSFQEDFSDEQVTSSYTEDLPALFNLDEHSSDDDLDVQNECIEEYSPDEASDSELQDAENRGIAQDDVWIEADTYEDKSLSTFLRNWSLEFNISQNAMKPLMQKLAQYDRTLPNSPRRLLRTPRTKPTIINIEGGEYWHQGVGKHE